MKIGILGYGEVGQAIAKFYKNPRVKDLKTNNFIPGLDIMHVCIPYENHVFAKIVSENIEEYKPKIVIIHSSVAVGITRVLFEKYRNVVHSPVRGVHPNLHKGIKTFIKYIGTEDKKLGAKVKKHYEKLGIKSEIIIPSMATELGKLLDTTYYGVCIAFHDYANDICDKLQIDFKDVMTRFNQTYNKGYTKLGKPEVARPVLYPPEGKIGGHCVIPNAKILERQFGFDELLTAILQHEEDKEI